MFNRVDSIRINTAAISQTFFSVANVPYISYLFVIFYLGCNFGLPVTASRWAGSISAMVLEPSFLPV